MNESDSQMLYEIKSDYTKKQVQLGDIRLKILANPTFEVLEENLEKLTYLIEVE